MLNLYMTCAFVSVVIRVCYVCGSVVLMCSQAPLGVIYICLCYPFVNSYAALCSYCGLHSYIRCYILCVYMVRFYIWSCFLCWCVLMYILI